MQPRHKRDFIVPGEGDISLVGPIVALHSVVGGTAIALMVYTFSKPTPWYVPTLAIASFVAGLTAIIVLIVAAAYRKTGGRPSTLPRPLPWAIGLGVVQLACVVIVMILLFR